MYFYLLNITQCKLETVIYCMQERGIRVEA